MITPTVNEVSANLLYLKNVLYWPEDDRLRSKHVAVLWPECTYYITVLIYCCVVTVYNTLYKRNVFWWCLSLCEYWGRPAHDDEQQKELNLFKVQRISLFERLSIAFQLYLVPVLAPISLFHIKTDHFTQWRTEGEGLGVQPLPRNPEGPPKSCQTQPDFENC